MVVAPSGTIPKTTSGKLQRSRVRNRYESGVLLLPRTVTSRMRLIGHVVHTQIVYMRAHATGMFRELTGRK